MTSMFTVVPVVDDALEQVGIRPLELPLKEAAADELAAIRDVRPLRQGSCGGYNVGLIEEDAA